MRAILRTPATVAADQIKRRIISNLRCQIKHTNNKSLKISALPLFVFLVGTDDENYASAPNDLAVPTNFLY
jgi:hypothetical protein